MILLTNILSSIISAKYIFPVILRDNIWHIIHFGNIPKLNYSINIVLSISIIKWATSAIFLSSYIKY